MKVFKFGGASVKDAESVKNISTVLDQFRSESIIVVVSAMGKTTNVLEEVARSYFLRQLDVFEKLDLVKEFHEAILLELFPAKHPIFDEVSNLFVEIEWALEEEPRPEYSYEYDQIVSIGELVSTRIVSAYLNQVNLKNLWIDARDVIKTDNKYQAASIDWSETKKHVEVLMGNDLMYVTQGFIGCTSENFTTTLGREGSDYSAAIFATLLKAESLVIWKDVPGVLNADPRYFTNPIKIDNLSFQEAIELAFYGASVIHPKTLQPLKRNNIPLVVRSFINHQEKGTLISAKENSNPDRSFYILKKNQILLSISVDELDFIVENHLSTAFSILDKHNARVSLVQNSAISCSFAIDVDDLLFESLIDSLSRKFSVKYNTGLELLTIRHYNEIDVKKSLVGKEIFLSQRNRTTIQILYK
ncbi:MAG: aspartate kinase [Flavobacteriales bacterium]|nr:aspartate kinase [Flavobacteriales bacterium]